MLPRVGIVILNWNGWEDTIECLESLYKIDYPNYDVILVDNASTDDSINKILDYCQGKIPVNSKFVQFSRSNKPIKVYSFSEGKFNRGEVNLKGYNKIQSDRRLVLIKNSKNYGFAKGCNIGAKFAMDLLDDEFLLFLNNDTVVDKYFLKNLVRPILKSKGIGVAGPEIYCYNHSGDSNTMCYTGGFIDEFRLWVPYSNIHTQKGGIIRKGLTDFVDWVTGAALLVRSGLFKKVGLFNEDYFFGFEDVELGIKVRRLGYKVVLAHDSTVWHKEGVSRKKKSDWQLHNFKAYFYFLSNNFPWWVVWYHVLLDLLYILFYSIPKYQRPVKEISNFMDGVIFLLKRYLR